MAGSWVSFENCMPSCSKAMALSDEDYLPALGLLLVMVCWCDDNLTDGLIPLSAIRRIAFGEWRKSLDALASVGWVKAVNGDKYQIHDYTDWQRSASHIRQLSEKRKAAAHARWGSKPDAKCNANTKQDVSKVQCTDSTDREDREEPRATAAAIEYVTNAYGMHPNLRQRERLALMCANYGEAVMERLAYGVAKAEEANKPNVNYCLGCADSASAQELKAFAEGPVVEASVWDDPDEARRHG